MGIGPAGQAEEQGTTVSVPVETERKWMVAGWPEDADVSGLALAKEELMRQGYVSVSPTVRIRSEETRVPSDGGCVCMLCFKSSGYMSRKEVEFPIPEERFAQIEQIIGEPLIDKVRRTYVLPDGRRLEVNHVDEGLPTEFWYAEIEFDSEEDALEYVPQPKELQDYLSDEVTNEPGQSMGAYWSYTRLGNKDIPWKKPE